MSETICCYVRVSTVGQNETSQKREIGKWLKGNGVSLDSVRWFVDKESGDNLNRPAFEDMQSAVFEGSAKTIIIWRLDRLSRKLKDGINVLCDWCEKGLRVVSVSQQIDFSGTVGKMLAAVLLGVAEMEQESRRERQRIGIEAAKERGIYIGRKAGTTKAKPSRAAELSAKGMTHGEIASALGVSRRTVIRYLGQ